MEKAPIPPDEAERLEALMRLNVLDTPAEERFDRITRLALHIFEVPISTLTLVDSEREWFKSCQGLPARQGPRAISFCGHAMLADEVFVIPDAKRDPRFYDNPMVAGPPNIRFYAGVPIRSVDGKRVGTFCIKDREPRNLDTKKVHILKALGAWAELELNFHELGRALEALRQAEEKAIDANKVLKLLNVILRHDILNDLTIIKGSLHLLNETRNERYIKDSLTIIERSIYLIEMMRELEKAVSTGAALKPFRVRDAVDKVIKGYPEIDFTVVGDCTVRADEALYSVIENVIRNAKQHGGAKHVRIAMKETDDRVEIVIANDGEDLPEEARARLFEEGYSYGKTGRTGLGLYIVRKTIERYGGSVRAERNVPRGAKFVFTLPKVVKEGA